MFKFIINLALMLFPKRKVIEGITKDYEEDSYKVKEKGVTICIDPGHGGEDPGAVYPQVNPTYIESVQALEISSHLVFMLDDAGYKVVITRADNDSHISRSDRIYAIKNSKADLLVSIHCNSFSSAAEGIETLYNSSNSRSKDLANSIQKAMVSNFPGNKDRGIKERNNLYVLKTLSPSCLVEVEFINTHGQWIQDNTKNIALSIFEGIEEFLTNDP